MEPRLNGNRSSTALQ